MTDNDETFPAVVRAKGDVATERTCLRCKAVFWSEGFGQRVCARCKATVSWRSAISDGNGQTRQR